MLEAPQGIREKILVTGSFGSGKTTAWLQVARWAKQTGSDAKFFVIDTDDAVSSMVRADEGLDNIVLYDAFEWEEYVTAQKKILPVARPYHDWIVVDFMSTSWEAVQDWYVRQMFGDPAEFFMSVRKGESGGMDGWKDWQYINRQYKAWAFPILFKSKAHLFLTAQADTLKDTDSKELRTDFGAHGVRPRGQKALSNQVHTVMLTRTLKPREVFLTTVKERRKWRHVLEAKPLEDFAIDYLVQVAGWTL